MKKTCEQCKKEFEDARGVAKFCSPNCRKLAYKRRQDASPSPSVADDLIATEKKILEDELEEIKLDLVDVCSEKELTDAPLMAEAKREKAENVYRLENNTLSELKKKHIWLPNWRRTQGENPGKAPDWNQ